MSEKNYRLPGFSAAGTGRVPGGFSLVEIMVALVIGMLGIIVMMQVFAMFEAQKRTTTGGDDAISSGSIALYSLQRDIQHAGWGISAINTADGGYLVLVETMSSYLHGNGKKDALLIKYDDQGLNDVHH